MGGNMSQESRQEILENMIDTYSLSEVLSYIADICSEKAEHIIASYNDKNLAGAWQDCSKSLINLSNCVGL